jgi:hypothetical protein
LDQVLFLSRPGRGSGWCGVRPYVSSAEPLCFVPAVMAGQSCLQVFRLSEIERREVPVGKTHRETVVAADGQNPVCSHSRKEPIAVGGSRFTIPVYGVSHVGFLQLWSEPLDLGSRVGFNLSRYATRPARGSQPRGARIERDRSRRTPHPAASRFSRSARIREQTRNIVKAHVWPRRIYPTTC